MLSPEFQITFVLMVKIVDTHQLGLRGQRHASKFTKKTNELHRKIQNNTKYY